MHFLARAPPAVCTESLTVGGEGNSYHDCKDVRQFGPFSPSWQLPECHLHAARCQRAAVGGNTQAFNCQLKAGELGALQHPLNKLSVLVFSHLVQARERGELPAGGSIQEAYVPPHT